MAVENGENGGNGVDQRSDRYTRERVEEIRTGYLQWARWTLWILLATVVIQIGFGIVSVYLYSKINTRFHDSLEIQCLESNVRHDDGLEELNRLINEAPTVPEGQKAKIKQNNSILIDKIVPKTEDCNKRATILSRSVD